jgi:hypothetical protein
MKYRNRISPDRRPLYTVVSFDKPEGPAYYVKDTLSAKLVAGPFHCIGAAQSEKDRWGVLGRVA